MWPAWKSRGQGKGSGADTELCGQDLHSGPILGDVPEEDRRSWSAQGLTLAPELPAPGSVQEPGRRSEACWKLFQNAFDGGDSNYFSIPARLDCWVLNDSCDFTEAS